MCKAIVYSLGKLMPHNQAHLTWLRINAGHDVICRGQSVWRALVASREPMKKFRCNVFKSRFVYLFVVALFFFLCFFLCRHQIAR